MRRIASHYIFWQSVYRLHFVEVDENSFLKGVFPLDRELSSTSFYNGVVVVLPSSSMVDEEFLYNRLLAAHTKHPEAKIPELLSLYPLGRKAEVEEAVKLFWLRDITFPASELGTDYSRSNSYIQRL